MPAYWIARAKVEKPEPYEKYTERAVEIVAKAGGRPRAVGGRYQILEGPSDYDRLAVIEFPSFETAVKTFESAEYQEAAGLRRDAGPSEFAAVNGVDLAEDETAGIAAYWIACVKITNPEQYQKYIDGTANVLPQSPARVLARGGEYQVLEGFSDYNRFVIVGWPSFDVAVEFFHSPGYQEVAALRRYGGGRAEIAIIEGV